MLHAFKPHFPANCFLLNVILYLLITLITTEISEFPGFKFFVGKFIHQHNKFCFFGNIWYLWEKTVVAGIVPATRNFVISIWNIFHRLCCNSWIPTTRSFFTSICQFFNFRCAPDKGNTFAFTSTSLLSSLYLLSFKSNALSLRFSVARVLV